MRRLPSKPRYEDCERAPQHERQFNGLRSSGGPPAVLKPEHLEAQQRAWTGSELLREQRARRREAALAKMLAWAFWILIAAALAIAGTCRPGPAAAAVFRALEFTAPDDGHGVGIPPAALQAERSYDGGQTWQATTLYDSPAASAPAPRPATPGTRQRVWISISTSAERWRAGGTAVRLFSVGANGVRSGQSNWIAVAEGPDTTWLAETAPRVTPRGGRWRRGAGPWFALEPRDSIAPLRIRHQETAQAAHLEALCRAFGYAARRGGRDTTWCQ